MSPLSYMAEMEADKHDQTMHDCHFGLMANRPTSNTSDESHPK